ncbi:hypothetical protein EPN96_04780 [bacterium]|nr:MAG: hypothetical protein EPN96_04780 [bacterium]
MNPLWAVLLLFLLLASAVSTAFGGSPVCSAFPGGFSAGSVSVEEVLARAADIKSFNTPELAPLDTERPAKVEIAQFGLG